jgi:flagellar motor protein MotB
MLLVGACSSSSGRSAQELGSRLQTQLAPDIAAGGVVLEQLPEGARVTLSPQALFANGKSDLDDKGRYVLASLIEALLAPRLLQIHVAASAEGPENLQAARAQAIRRYFEDYELGPALLPEAGMQPTSAGATLQELTVTVTMVSG